jgi:hypothetical protein
MGNNIFINGLGAVHKESGGIATSVSVNWTKVGKHTVPIPYSVVSKSADCDKTASTVTVNNNPVCHIESEFTKTSGDSPGKKKGIVSRTVGDKALFLSGSSNVFFEGKSAVRALDLMTLNNGNTPSTPLIQSAGSSNANKVNLPAELSPPEQAYEIGIRACGDYYPFMVLQHTDNTDAVYRGTISGLDDEEQQGMPSHKKLTDNLIEGDYYLWVMEKDIDGGSNYTDLHVEKQPMLKDNSGWLATPVPVPLSSNAMEDENEPQVDLIPFVPACVTTQNKLSAFDSGWIYLFINGYLWREIQVKDAGSGAASYRDVNLMTFQGKDTRPATGEENSTLWLPAKLNGEETAIHIAHSCEQWGWSYIRRLGGMNPETDPRFIEELHNPFELEAPDNDTSAYLIPDAATRLTEVPLSRFNAKDTVTLPEPLAEDSLEDPTPGDFPVLVPLSSSGLPEAIVHDAEVQSNNPDMPVIIVPNALQLAIQLAVQHNVAWTMFQNGISLLTDPEQVEGLIQEGIELTEEQKEQANEVYRFQSAALIHKMFVQQPKELRKSTGDSEQDQANSEIADRLEKWATALADNHKDLLEQSLQKTKITALKQDVLRTRGRYIDFFREHRSSIDACYLDMAARHDELGYYYRNETARTLFGHLCDSVKNWEETVFDPDDPLDGAADTNEHGKALFDELLAEKSIYHESLFVLAKPGIEESLTHSGMETSVPDGIGGCDGNILREWAVANKVGSGNTASAIKMFIAAANALHAEVSKRFSEPSELSGAGINSVQARELEELSSQLHNAMISMNDELGNTNLNNRALDEQQQLSTRQFGNILEQIENFQSEQSRGLASALVVTQSLRLEAEAELRQLFTNIKNTASLAKQLKDRLLAEYSLYSQRAKAFDNAVSKVLVVQQQLLDEHRRLSEARLNSNIAIENAKRNVASHEETIITKTNERNALKAKVRPGQNGHASRRKVSAKDLEISAEKQRLVTANQALTDEQLKQKIINRDISLLERQLAQQGLFKNGEIASAPNVANAISSVETPHTLTNMNLRWATVRTSAVMGIPAITGKFFGFELLGNNTRPGTVQPLASLHKAGLVENGTLRQLAGISGLDDELNRVAATLLLFDSNNTALSHLKADAKKQIEATLLLDAPTAKALEDCRDMASFNRFMEAHREAIDEYTEFFTEYVEQFDSEIKNLNRSALALDGSIAALKQLHIDIHQSLKSKLSKSSAVMVENAAKWAKHAIRGAALSSRKTIVDLLDNSLLRELNVQEAKADAIRKALQMPGVNEAQRELAKNQVLKRVSKHLEYLEDIKTPGKATWTKGLKGNGVALSCFLVIGGFEVVNLKDVFSELIDDFSGENFIKVVGSLAYTGSIAALIWHQWRIAAAGAIDPLLETYAGKLTRKFIISGFQRNTFQAVLPEYLDGVVHTKNAPAFNKLLVKTVMASSLANGLGFFGDLISIKLLAADIGRYSSDGNEVLAAASKLMLVGKSVSAISSFAALSQGLWGGATVINLGGGLIGRSLLILAGPVGFWASLIIQGIALYMMMNNSQDGMTTLLQNSTWGKYPYKDLDKWQKDATAEWMDLHNAFENPPQASWCKGALRCDEPLKRFQLWLPGFNENSSASLYWQQTISQRSQPLNPLADYMDVIHGAIPIEHSTTIDLDVRLTNALRRLLQGHLNKKRQNANITAAVEAEQKENGLLLTFVFNHFELVERTCAFTQHSLNLEVALYPQGRSKVIGVNQLPYALPAQPPLQVLQEIQAKKSEKYDYVYAGENTQYINLVTGIISSAAYNADQWIEQWHKEAEPRIKQMQDDEANERLSAWQQGTGDNPNNPLDELLGNKAASVPTQDLIRPLS